MGCARTATVIALLPAAVFPALTAAIGAVAGVCSAQSWAIQINRIGRDKPFEGCIVGSIELTFPRNAMAKMDLHSDAELSINLRIDV